MFLESLALIYGFPMYIKPVRVQMPHVHNYHYFRSTTSLWRSFIWFCLDILKQILWGILFGFASRVNRDKLTVSEMVQDIELVDQRDWFMSYLLSVQTWNYHVINICDLFIQLVWKLERSLCESICWWLRLAKLFSDW